MSLDSRERNRLANEYRREAQAVGIVSPFRQYEYINARISGKTKEQAEAIAKAGPGNKQT